MKKKNSYLLVISLIIIIVILAAFFASNSPDGLEFVAEKLGFLTVAKNRAGIFTDYSLSNSILGVFICLGLAFIISKVLVYQRH